MCLVMTMCLHLGLGVLFETCALICRTLPGYDSVPGYENEPCLAILFHPCMLIYVTVRSLEKVKQVILKVQIIS